jgi:hypothetical protein
MELVYTYLTGPTFRHRVEAMVEKFSDMREDLDRERRTMTRLWAKRESQIQGVLDATVGMYGDLQGIAGKALPEIAALELPLLGSCETQTAHREQKMSEDQSDDQPVRYMVSALAVIFTRTTAGPFGYDALSLMRLGSARVRRRE